MTRGVVDGRVDCRVRPRDPWLAAHTVVAAIDAAPELTRWVPRATPTLAADPSMRAAFARGLCPGVPARR